MTRLLLRHLQVLLSSLGRMSQRPVSSALTLIGIGVALAVPLSLYVLVLNLSTVFGDFGDAPRLTVYVDRAAGDTAGYDLATLLDEDSTIERVVVIDRQQGLAQLLEEDALADLKGRITDNPLPDVIEVMPRATLDEAGYRALAARLAALDEVTEVQVDLQWVSRLQAITDLAVIVVRAFWILLFAGVAMVISNSVRLSLVTAREEIEVISLVGGSEGFIRRPYLYSGLLQGLLGALVAVLIAFAVYLLLLPALAQMLKVYVGVFEVVFAPAPVVAGVVLLSGLLGWLASLVTVSRFLGEILPR